MYPLLKQCYESALGARSLASSLKSGESGSLKLALSRSIDLELLMPQLLELKLLFNGVELKFLRGVGPEVVEYLKKGEAELAIAASLGDDWERLDSWPLFTENFFLTVNSNHHLANRTFIEFEDLRQERLLLRTYCEHTEELVALFRSHDIDVDHCHVVTSERDLMTLLEANIGVAVVPRSAANPATLMRAPINGLELRRTVHLYGVAGRQRTPVANTIMKMLRGANWSRFAN
jgi:DNA-binding transcriptional LysR family regulator